jgi:hypothetical protein
MPGFESRFCPFFSANRQYNTYFHTCSRSLNLLQSGVPGEIHSQRPPGPASETWVSENFVPLFAFAGINPGVAHMFEARSETT